MKKIEKGSKKYLLLLICSVALCGFILYPLFDFILCKFFTKTEFVYSFNSYIVEPIIFAVFYGLTFFLIDKKNNKKGE